MDIIRANPHLNEFIEMMDEYYIAVQGNTYLAWEKLGTTEKDFIAGEILHCVTDPRYYLENYHIIRTEHQGLKTLSPFWDSQEIFYEAVIELKTAGGQVKIMILKARQLGLSTICEGMVFWKTLFTPTCNTLIVATDTMKADDQFEMSRLAYDCLPWWMRPEVRYDQKGRVLQFDRKDDLMRKMSPGMRSNIFVEAANKDTGVARGKTIRCCHMSELATWDNGEALTQQIFPTMNAPDVMAFMESTAEGRSGFWYRFWRDTVDGKTTWHPVFIPFYRVRKYSLPIKKGETFIATADEEEYRKKILEDSAFNISDEVLNWRRIKAAEFVSLEGDEFGFMQEYPSNWMEAFQGSGVCAFNRRLLYKLLATTCVAPRFVGEINYDRDARKERVALHPVNKGEILHNPKTEDRFWVWEKPEEEATYYVSGDVAQGVEGGDFSCIEVLKIGAGMEPDVQVAEWRGWINPTPFAYIVCAVATYYNMAQVAVECNNVGKVTNNEIFRVIEYDNIYRWKHLDKVKNFMTDFMGWETNWKSRDAIIAKMNEALLERSIVLRSELLIDEMMDFAFDENGEGKAKGRATKDDRVMAMMICRYCAHESDYGKAALARPMNSSSAGNSTWYVLDKFNRKIGEYKERAVAYAEFQKYPGGSIMAAPQATDHFNTIYSPIYNSSGIRSRMYYDLGYTPESINHETVTLEQIAEEPPDISDPNAWLQF
jgi:hypothetical protein